jgi:phosphatidylglycerophosphate synthase
MDKLNVKLIMSYSRKDGGDETGSHIAGYVVNPLARWIANTIPENRCWPDLISVISLIAYIASSVLLTLSRPISSVFLVIGLLLDRIDGRVARRVRMCASASGDLIDTICGLLSASLYYFHLVALGFTGPMLLFTVLAFILIFYKRAIDVQRYGYGTGLFPAEDDVLPVVILLHIYNIVLPITAQLAILVLLSGHFVRLQRSQPVRIIEYMPCLYTFANALLAFFYTCPTIWPALVLLEGAHIIQLVTIKRLTGLDNVAGWWSIYGLVLLFAGRSGSVSKILLGTIMVAKVLDLGTTFKQFLKRIRNIEHKYSKKRF